MHRLMAKALCAPDAVGNCKRHAAAHTHALQRYGIANVTSAHQTWWKNPNTFAVLLEDEETDEPLGGVRLQCWGNGVALPVEGALGNVDPQVHAWVASFADRGVAELCGLWCSPKLQGFGLGAVLTRMGISLASKLGATTLLGLCDTRNVEQNKKLGFCNDQNLALEGRFEYPRPGLTAHVLRIPNTYQLAGATLANRAEVNAYREVPVGFETLGSPERALRLERNLNISRPAQTPKPSAFHARRPAQLISDAPDWN